MLILTRKLGESIIVQCQGEVAEIKLTKIEGDRVKLGIEAPQDIRILRKELQKEGR